MADRSKTRDAKISFPINCDYKGGIVALGKHGKHLWIKDGQLGVGEFRLTHGIPLKDVAGVEITERSLGGTQGQTLAGLGFGRPGATPASQPKQVTEITVRTKDGQEGLWLVDHRGGDWVRSRLAPTLKEAGISL